MSCIRGLFSRKKHSQSSETILVSEGRGVSGAVAAVGQQLDTDSNCSDGNVTPSTSSKGQQPQEAVSTSTKSSIDTSKTAATASASLAEKTLQPQQRLLGGERPAQRTTPLRNPGASVAGSTTPSVPVASVSSGPREGLLSQGCLASSSGHEASPSHIASPPERQTSSSRTASARVYQTSVVRVKSPAEHTASLERPVDQPSKTPCRKTVPVTAGDHQCVDNPVSNKLFNSPDQILLPSFPTSTSRNAPSTSTAASAAASELRAAPRAWAAQEKNPEAALIPLPPSAGGSKRAAAAKTVFYPIHGEGSGPTTSAAAAVVVPVSVAEQGHSGYHHYGYGYGCYASSVGCKLAHVQRGLSSTGSWSSFVRERCDSGLLNARNRSATETYRPSAAGPAPLRSWSASSLSLHSGGCRRERSIPTIVVNSRSDTFCPHITWPRTSSTALQFWHQLAVQVTSSPSNTRWESAPDTTIQLPPVKKSASQRQEPHVFKVSCKPLPLDAPYTSSSSSCLSTAVTQAQRCLESFPPLVEVCSSYKESVACRAESWRTSYPEAAVPGRSCTEVRQGSCEVIWSKFPRQAETKLHKLVEEVSGKVQKPATSATSDTIEKTLESCLTDSGKILESVVKDSGKTLETPIKDLEHRQKDTQDTRQLTVCVTVQRAETSGITLQYSSSQCQQCPLKEKAEEDSGLVPASSCPHRSKRSSVNQETKQAYKTEDIDQAGLCDEFPEYSTVASASWVREVKGFLTDVSASANTGSSSSVITAPLTATGTDLDSNSITQVVTTLQTPIMDPVASSRNNPSGASMSSRDPDDQQGGQLSASKESPGTTPERNQPLGQSPHTSSRAGEAGHQSSLPVLKRNQVQSPREPKPSARQLSSQMSGEEDQPSSACPSPESSHLNVKSCTPPRHPLTDVTMLVQPECSTTMVSNARLMSDKPLDDSFNPNGKDWDCGTSGKVSRAPSAFSQVSATSEKKPSQGSIPRPRSKLAQDKEQEQRHGAVFVIKGGPKLQNQPKKKDVHSLSHNLTPMPDSRNPQQDHGLTPTDNSGLSSTTITTNAKCTALVCELEGDSGTEQEEEEETEEEEEEVVGLMDVFQLEKTRHQNAGQLHSALKKYRKQQKKTELLQRYVIHQTKELEELSRMIRQVESQGAALKEESKLMHEALQKTCDSMTFEDETMTQKHEPLIYKKYSATKTGAEAKTLLCTIHKRQRALQLLEAMTYRKLVALQHNLKQIEPESKPDKDDKTKKSGGTKFKHHGGNNGTTSPPVLKKPRKVKDLASLGSSTSSSTTTNSIAALAGGGGRGGNITNSILTNTSNTTTTTMARSLPNTGISLLPFTPNNPFIFAPLSGATGTSSGTMALLSQPPLLPTFPPPAPPLPQRQQQQRQFLSPQPHPSLMSRNVSVFSWPSDGNLTFDEVTETDNI